MHDSASASASCTFVASSTCSNQGHWAASGQPTCSEPHGEKYSHSDDRGAIQSAYRHAILQQTLTRIYQEIASSPSARPPQPFTWCYVGILLVDVAPIGLPTLITVNDARFCVTTFTILHLFQVMVHGILLCLVNSRSSHSEEVKLLMPLTSFGTPARRRALYVNLNWLQCFQS